MPSPSCSSCSTTRGLDVPGGFVGVDVFFVISGYLITGLLLREHEKRRSISIPGFYARRARRILPAAMVVIVATLLIAHHIQNAIAYTQYNDGGEVGDAVRGELPLRLRAAPTTSCRATLAPSPFLHFWSLAVEEQFYVVWPTIVLLVGLLATLVPLRRTSSSCALAGVVASFLSVHHERPGQRDLGLLLAVHAGVGARARRARGHRHSSRSSSGSTRWAGVVLAWARPRGDRRQRVDATRTRPSFPGTNALLPVLGAVAIIVGGDVGDRRRAPARAPTDPRGRPRLVRVVPPALPADDPVHSANLYIPGKPLPGPRAPRDRGGHARRSPSPCTTCSRSRSGAPRRLARRPWVSIAMGAGFVLAAFLVCALYHKGLYG